MYDTMIYTSSNTERVHAFSSVCQLLINPGIFRKRCTRGRNYKEAVVECDLD